MSGVEPAVGPALPGEPCRVPPHESWSELEKWVWREIGSGRIADINAKFGWCPLPNCPAAWSSERRLSPNFLETILLHNPWRDATPRHGVRIEGAWFCEAIDLSQSELGSTLWLDRARFEADVSLRALRTDGFVSLVGAAFEKTLDLSLSYIDRGLNLTGSDFGGLLNLTGIRVGGQAVLTNASGKTARLDGAIIDGGLHILRRAHFGDVELQSARIGIQLATSGLTVSGTLQMNAVVVSGNYVSKGARLTFLDLSAAKISGHVDLSFVNIAGCLDLSFAEIEGSLDLRAELARVDLRGCRIRGELHLASAGPGTWPRWQEGAVLKLRNARADAIPDERRAWPAELELGGFCYNRFGGYSDTDERTAQHSSQWFVEWLARDRPYSPQPYHQCAKVLREMGHPEMADDVLYAGRERERDEARQKAQSDRNYARFAGLWLLQSTIGYGYGHRYFRSLKWVLLLGLVGIVVLLLSGSDEKIAGAIVWSPKGITSYLLALAFYSFDLLLPIMQLYEPHYQIVLDGFAKYYFGFHKLMGYLLASFLIAGLAGLTK